MEELDYKKLAQEKKDAILILIARRLRQVSVRFLCLILLKKPF